MEQEKKLIWYIRDGVACSGYILCDFTLGINVESDSWRKEQYLKMIMEKFCINVDEKQCAGIEGDYYFLSGMNLVKKSECFDTKREAVTAWADKQLQEE